MSYYNRPPPADQDYYYPPRTWHFDDWQAALPGDIYVRTWCAPVHVDPHRRSPPMSPETSDRDHQPPGDRTKRRSNNSRGEGSGQSRNEGSRGEGARDNRENTETQVITRPKPKPDTAADRQRRLIELRLLLLQLRTQLEAAFNFYSPAVDEFKNETEQLRNYARKETLDRAWANKLQAKAKEATTADSTAVEPDMLIMQVGLCLKHLRSAKAEKLYRCAQSAEGDAVVEQKVAGIISHVERVMELAQDAKRNAEISESLVAELNEAGKSTDIDSPHWKPFLRKQERAEGHVTGQATTVETDDF